MRTSELGRGSAGVWTREHATAVLSAGGVDALLRRGTWQQLLPGVYTDAGHQPDATQLAWAAVLTSGRGAVACGRTAARLWSLPLIDDLDPATGAADHRNHDVAVPRNVGTLSESQRHGGRVHRRQLRLATDQVAAHPSGLLVTSPARTLRDLAGVLTLEALVCAVDDALRRGLVDADQLAALVLAAKGSRHVRRLTTAVDLADPGAATPAESLARLLLRPHLPGLRCQVPVHDDRGTLLAVLDLADDELMLAVEVDGKRGHAGTQMVAKDRRRDRRTEALGWWTERVTWFELRRRSAEVVHRVVAAARRRAAAA
jgi:hypothetical protein